MTVQATLAGTIGFAMAANISEQETELITAAITWLRQILPGTWTVEPSNRQIAMGSAQQRLDGAIDVKAANGTYTTFAVEAKEALPPRDVDRLLPRLALTLRSLAGNTPVLVVAPWLSSKTQELLAQQSINYLDLTGNALIQLENPTLFVKSAGANRDPEPTLRGRARVRGPKAARVVRLLADVRPPYGVREIASATGLAPGYVSRLLDTLDREAIVDRSPRGRVESVDTPGLLRQWAGSYDVFKTNDVVTFIARGGAKQALTQIAQLSEAGNIAISGSFAAVRLAPVAAPSLLLAYCAETARVAQALDLLPADEGANVALLKPFDPVVWERTTQEDGVQYVAPSQVAVDCLTGNGRMPAEGEAVLKWMTEDEMRWRLPSLTPLDPNRDHG